MPDACAFFFVLGAWLGVCVCCGGGCVDVFPFYFRHCSSTVKKKYSASSLIHSRLPWPFGRVNVAAGSVFSFSIGLPYDTSTVQPAVYQFSFFAQTRVSHRISQELL